MFLLVISYGGFFPSKASMLVLADEPMFKVFLLGHKILKSTSVDCNKINIVTVMVRIMMMWESPSDSHATAIQWVHMVKDPPATILLVHTVTSKYTSLLSIMIGV